MENKRSDSYKQGKGDQAENQAPKNRMGFAGLPAGFIDGLQVFIQLYAGGINRSAFRRGFLFGIGTGTGVIILRFHIIPGSPLSQLTNGFFRRVGRNRIGFTVRKRLPGIIINKIICNNRTTIVRFTFKTSSACHRPELTSLQ